MNPLTSKVQNPTVLIANPNWQALFTFRIGYPTIEALSSPLRSVQEVVVEGSRI